MVVTWDTGISLLWIYEKREPTEKEFEIAVIASTIPAAAQSVQPGRWLGQSSEKAAGAPATHDTRHIDTR
jgi:hypothetical protein